MMALWLVRAGPHGEFEQKFLAEGRVYLTWSGLTADLAQLADRDALRTVFEETYPDASKGQVSNNVGQIWTFARKIAVGDWFVMPSKYKPAIHFAEVTGEYTFVPGAEDPFHHYRSVQWIAQDIPRSNFDQDLLHSFGAYMTVCRISRNNAEARIHAMAQGGWKAGASTVSSPVPSADDAADSDQVETDLVQAARDEIAKLMLARFQGHGMERVVDAVLRAQGYVTHHSPPGPDGGVDILAPPAPMGFGEPRLCVQVKSGDTPLDRPTLDQLIGVMQKMNASHGLLVSWGGFKSSVDRESVTQFFNVRLWDQDDLIDEVLGNYDRLGEDIRAELPLRRIWVVAKTGE